MKFGQADRGQKYFTIDAMKPTFAILFACVSLHAADTECRWTAVPPVIDGKLDDAAWQQAQVIDTFQSAWLPEGQRTPPTKTKARLLWDHEYLYFAAELEDTDVFANVIEQDGPAYLNDVFELFFKPARDKPGYYEFEINAANTKMDLFLPSRGSGATNRHGTERDFHIDSVVQVHGTLNNWKDIDKGWTVEGRIPWRDFLSTGGRPAPGEVWLHALCRYDYSAGLPEVALSSSAPLSKSSFHRYEDYIGLKFVGPDAGAASKRVPWDTSRLAGSPDAPLPFRAVPAFAKLKTNHPVTIVNEPGRDGFLLLETSGYYTPTRTSRLSRLANNPDATSTETLLEFDETVYDVCFHPRFAENGFIYLGSNVRVAKDDCHSHVLRYTMDRKTGRIDPASRLVIIEWASDGHNGAALCFGMDGMFYITSGDGSKDSDALGTGQDLTRLQAKLLRVDVDHPFDGKAYSIPKDNPFLQVADARPETWAYGFRNPWRMTMDRETGELWVGENGQDLWEYARIVHRGENYGWAIVEGSHEFHQQRKPGPTPITKPLIEHSHTDFRSLTGGIVYRGAKFPALVGRYVYGDFGTGQIWSAQQRDGLLIKNEPIARSAAITSFCETPQGRILIVDHLGGSINQLALAANSQPARPFPAKLSETGLFTDTRTLKPHPALIPYAVNAPAWHDGATSQRYIALPGTERMEFTEQGGWQLPDGTALVQTLSLNQQRIETRVLLRDAGEWTGYSYVWDATQTDAVRMAAAGETRTLASGQSWRIPGKQECAMCHSRQSNFVLGISTVQLNRDDQLAQWELQGLLKFDHAPVEEREWRKEFEDRKLSEAVKQTQLALVTGSAMQRQPASGSTLLPHAARQLARLANPSDATAALADRARAYLHANCAHCHMQNSGGNSNMQLASHVPDGEMALINGIPLHATFGIPEARLMIPADPVRSMLIYRSAVRGAGQMPPVGTLTSDGEGIALLARWITSLPVTK